MEANPNCPKCHVSAVYRNGKVLGKKGGKVGLDIDKPLIMREENGNYTKRLSEIYGM